MIVEHISYNRLEERYDAAIFTESMQLRGVEQAKIACARKLFNEISDTDVRYDAVDSYEKLLELVRG